MSKPTIVDLRDALRIAQQSVAAERLALEDYAARSDASDAHDLFLAHRAHVQDVRLAMALIKQGSTQGAYKLLQEINDV